MTLFALGVALLLVVVVCATVVILARMRTVVVAGLKFLGLALTFEVTQPRDTDSR